MTAIVYPVNRAAPTKPHCTRYVRSSAGMSARETTPLVENRPFQIRRRCGPECEHAPKPRNRELDDLDSQVVRGRAPSRSCHG